MKNSILVTLLFFTSIFWANRLTSQDIVVKVNGLVQDLTSYEPISNQLVSIEISADGMQYQQDLFTNEEGAYESDSVIVSSEGVISATVFDCEGIPHIQTDTFTLSNSFLIFDFLICSDSNNNCQADFSYEYLAPPDTAILFTNLSTGIFEFQYWDFGDGQSSTQPDGVHAYNSPGEYLVCLTIWSDDSSCFDATCETITITGDSCWNSFIYESDDQVSFMFTAESFPGPADYYSWDFGDGETGYGAIINHTYDSTFFGLVNVTLTTYTQPVIPGGDSCIAQSSQEIWVGNVSQECENWFDYSTNDNQTFDFNGYPNPDADHYFWSFGDGQTANGQNVSHTYMYNIDTTVLVSLETWHTNPLGDTCVAMSQQYINVGNEECYAGFTYTVDSLNPFLYSFTDVSTGPVTTYLWDFGEGTSSEEQHPEHLFNDSGSFLVCLTIESDSLGYFCTDTFCEEVQVNYVLTASFEFFQDTLSGEPNVFQFVDFSTGNPDSWYWDFGDGLFSYEQNPVHQYNNPGDYEVCLTAHRMITGNNYVDSICQVLPAPEYFELGGQVYLDNIPMNNFNGDTTIVDHGMAYLYKVYENTLIPSDTQSFDTYGYYWFTNIREGKYLVKIRMMENSLHFDEYAPGYHIQSFSWNDASPILLTDTSQYNSEVRLQSMADLTAGITTLSGYISYAGLATPLLSSLEGVDVLLLNADQQLVKKTLTIENGDFIFEEIPPGSYFLYSEATGLFTYPEPIEVETGMPAIQNIHLQIYEQVLDIPEINNVSIHLGNPYPNPVNKKLWLDYKLVESQQVFVEVFDISGRLLIEESQLLLPGNASLEVDVKKLKKGIYFLNISFPAERTRFIRKIIK